jgi:hypothetical protein
VAGVIGGIHIAISPRKENRMSPSKLGTMVAILATAAGFSAHAGRAEAQISGTIGGDIIAKDPLQVLGTIHVVGGENERFRVRVENYDRLDGLLGTAFNDTWSRRAQW